MAPRLRHRRHISVADGAMVPCRGHALPRVRCICAIGPGRGRAPDGADVSARGTPAARRRSSTYHPARDPSRGAPVPRRRRVAGGHPDPARGRGPPAVGTARAELAAEEPGRRVGPAAPSRPGSRRAAATRATGSSRASPMRLARAWRRLPALRPARVRRVGRRVGAQRPFTRIDDARDAIGAMRSRRELDLRRTAIVGHGEGAGIALSVAIGDPAIGAVGPDRRLRPVPAHRAAPRRRGARPHRDGPPSTRPSRRSTGPPRSCSSAPSVREPVLHARRRRRRGGPRPGGLGAGDPHAAARAGHDAPPRDVCSLHGERRRLGRSRGVGAAGRVLADAGNAPQPDARSRRRPRPRGGARRRHRCASRTTLVARMRATRAAAGAAGDRGDGRRRVDSSA